MLLGTKIDTIDSYLESMTNGQALKYAVQKAMCCQVANCGQILDCETNAVLIEMKVHVITCVNCYYTLLECGQWDSPTTQIKDYPTHIAPKAPKYLPIPTDLSGVKSDFGIFGTNRCQGDAWYTDGKVLLKTEVLKCAKRFRERKNLKERDAKFYLANFRKYSDTLIDSTLSTCQDRNQYKSIKIKGFNRYSPVNWSKFKGITAPHGANFDAQLLAQMRKYIKGEYQILTKDNTSPARIELNNGCLIGLVMPMRKEG